MGIWAGARFLWRPGLYAAGLALSALAAALLPIIGKRRVVGVMGVYLFAGALWAGYAAHPALPQADKYHFTGVLSADLSIRDNGSVAVYLEQVRIEGEDGGQRLGKAYWIYTPDPKSPFLPQEGDQVAFAGRLYHPSGQANPYGFDFRMFLLQKGVTVGILGARESEIIAHPGRGLRSITYHIRQALVRRVQAVFGEGSALPEALLLGSRDNLPEDMVRHFSNAGVAHLLAVSGLHVALLAGSLMLPLRRIFKPGQRLAVLAAFLLFYCALLDFSAPIMRASALLLLGYGRRIVRRARDGLTALAAAFALILLIRPLDLFSASFQLSFCAVLGIVAIFPELERRFHAKNKRLLLEGLGTTLAATLGVALPTIQIFHSFSLMGLLLNPIACAVFSVLLPVYAAVLMVGCVSLPLGAALAAPVNVVSNGLTSAIDFLGAVPFARLRMPALPWYCVLAVAVALALSTRFTLGRPKRKVAAAALLLVCALSVWQLTQCRDVRYIQLAMGQADAALILDGPETVVIDTGSYGGDLADYLLSTGRRADHLILSHLHTDHCMGVRALLDEEIPIGTLYLPQGAEEQKIDPSCLALLREVQDAGVPVMHLCAGDTVKTSRTSGTVTWPIDGTVRPDQDANRYSLTLLWNLDGVTLLSTGDLTGDYERYAARDADILKVPHHGSKNSTGVDFLCAVSPDVALITGSDSVTALLPNPATLRRLEQAGIPWYNTADTGALTVTIHDGAATLTPFLPQRSSYEAQ
ncbi:MAG: DNA internalization-related competence protein ComEC/Rec2 [Clostridia bacterium]|nr:DNA internalization-related competence protein ComEC/Rec2 [Clostridia bacterium]